MLGLGEVGNDLVKKIHDSKDFSDYEKSLLIEGIRSRENLVLADRQPIKNEACEKCSKNPKNGGDGICHCILGLPLIT